LEEILSGAAFKMAKLAGRIAERQRGAITTLRQFRRPDRGDFARRKIERAALYAKEELGRDAVAVYSPEVETWAKGKEAPSEEEPGVEALVAGTVEEGKQIPQFRSGEEPPESIRNAVVRIREQVQDAAVERDRRLHHHLALGRTPKRRRRQLKAPLASGEGECHAVAGLHLAGENAGAGVVGKAMTSHSSNAFSYSRRSTPRAASALR